MILLAAMAAETSGFGRFFRLGRERRAGELRYRVGGFEGTALLVGTCGIGKDKAAGATETLLTPGRLSELLAPPQAIVSFGVAGALGPGYQLHEFVLCQSIGDEAGGRVDSDPRLAAAARESLDATSYLWREATSLTVNRVIGSPIEKAALHRETGAGIVEMESFEIGRVAAQNRVPSLTLRAISDLDETPLPDFSKFMVENRVDRSKLAIHLVKHPRDGARLAHFLAVTRTAATRFVRVFEELIPRIGNLSP
ncbi:MAG: hypothetical protein WEB00_00365 [Dehalococcoidia bacterium]